MREILKLKSTVAYNTDYFDLFVSLVKYQPQFLLIYIISLFLPFLLFMYTIVVSIRSLRDSKIYNSYLFINSIVMGFGFYPLIKTIESLVFPESFGI